MNILLTDCILAWRRNFMCTTLNKWTYSCDLSRQQVKCANEARCQCDTTNWLTSLVFSQTYWISLLWHLIVKLGNLVRKTSLHFTCTFIWISKSLYYIYLNFSHSFCNDYFYFWWTLSSTSNWLFSRHTSMSRSNFIFINNMFIYIFAPSYYYQKDSRMCLIGLNKLSFIIYVYLNFLCVCWNTRDLPSIKQINTNM